MQSLSGGLAPKHLSQNWWLKGLPDMETRNRFLNEVTSLDKTAVNFSTGLRAAAFVVAPMILRIAFNYPELTFACLGTLFLINTEGPRFDIPLIVLLIACFTESLSWALGTIAGTTEFLAPFLLGIFVLFVVLLTDRPKWIPVGTFTSIVFAVGVGLPGGTLSDAIPRAAFALAGSLWGLGGAMLHRYLISRKAASATNRTQNLITPKFQDRITRGFAVGLASALGLTLGLAAHLPRDYWVVFSIIIIMQVGAGSVTSVTSLFLGTVAGAILAAAVTLEVTNEFALAVILFVFAFLGFSSRGVNLGFTQIFFVPFLIVLLNLNFPGQWELAFVRILDVGIGGAIGIGVTHLLRAWKLAFRR